MARKILVVDDNKINRELLQKLLCDEYEVIDAANGNEALAILRRESTSVSAVLLDIVMPEMDGFEVLRRIRADERLTGMPVIVATGSADENTEVEALAQGANDYVTKPYNQGVIKHRLRNTIHLHETASAISRAKRDDLTRLYNRKTFFQLADDMIAAQPAGYYVMACFNVDNFKVINDQYGTRKGDAVLKKVAEIFENGFSPSGGICCRIMADHFAVLYPKSFLDSPQLEKIRNDITVVDGIVRPITFSVGRYLVDDLSLTANAMYDRATIAEASVKGRYDVHVALYSEAMREKILQEQEIIGEMNAALTSKQFEVWLQPQYNHVTGAMIGAEALVRWRHPEKGLISPGRFIPVFERNGFVYEVDKFVWEQVCVLLQGWIKQGRTPLPVSVNISRYDVFRSDLCDVITGLVQRYEIPVQLLRLEITESAFATSAEQIISVVKQLVGFGFTVEIDDFGSGYSSLNTLKDVPANILKLDMRFLEGEENSQRGGNILESIIRMAKWIDMPVIAEGVETKEQADYLATIGCCFIQGYLYAKPMPVPEYEALVAKSTKESSMPVLEKVETLDNNAFWDPNSLETLIFNSYVGGACVVEYSKKKIEMLRANNQFAEMIGGKTMTIADVMKIEWRSHVDLHTRKRIKDAIYRSVHTGEEVTLEVTCQSFDGSGTSVYIRIMMRVIAHTSERYLIYCVCENITEKCQTEQKIKEVNEQLLFLNDTANDLLLHADPSAGMDCVLRKTLSYFAGGRVFVYEYYAEEDTCANTFEVCAPGVAANPGLYQKAPLHAARFWRKAFEEAEYLHITDVAQIDGSYCEDHEICKCYEAKSVLAVPLRVGGRLVGAVGVVDPTCHLNDYDNLRALGNYMTVLLARRDNSIRIQNQNNQMVNLMNDMPGGFARLHYQQDGSIAMVYINDSLCRMLDTTCEQALRLYGKHALGCVHPDDVERLTAAIGDMFANGGRLSMRCRIKHTKRGYIDVMIFARLIYDSAGECFINAYYTDLSEREKEELSLREMLPVALSAVMESATDIAFVKDKTLSYICCSQALARLAGLNDRKQVVGKTDYDLLDKEIADKYFDADKRVLESGQPILNLVESLPTKDGTIRYANTSKYPLCDAAGSVIGVYGIGQDMTDIHSGYAQLKLLADHIPGGLAIMECSADSLRLLYFNELFYQRTGYSRSEYRFFSDENPLFLVYAEDLPQVKEQFDAVFQNSSSLIDATYRIHTKTNGFRWQNLKGSLGSRSGDTAILNLILSDVTEQREAEARLRLSEEQYRLAVSLSGNSICQYDVAAKTLSLPPDVAEAFGQSEELKNVPYEPVRFGTVSPESVDAFIGFFEQILHGENAGIASFRYMMVNGWRWLRASYSTIFNEAGEPVSAIIAFVDTTEEHRKEEEHKFIREQERLLKQKAEMDGMTGLYNKATAEAMISQRMVHGTSRLCAMMLIDLDNLKKINDNLGHPQGDKTIRLLADVLGAQFRRTDIVGRLGGDEFVAFLDEISSVDDLDHIVEVLYKKLSMVRTGEQDDLPISASIGVAVGIPRKDTFAVMYERADKALYYAKRNGKNQAAFYSTEIEANF